MTLLFAISLVSPLRVTFLVLAAAVVFPCFLLLAEALFFPADDFAVVTLAEAEFFVVAAEVTLVVFFFAVDAFAVVDFPLALFAVLAVDLEILPEASSVFCFFLVPSAATLVLLFLVNYMPKENKKEIK